MFRRRRDPDDSAEIDELEDLQELDDLDAPADTTQESSAPSSPPSSAPTRPQGPWDVEDAPGDDRAELDLGALRVGMVDGVELRLEAAEDQTTVVAATFVRGQSSLQVMPFAAPRSSGIWAEVRDEIAASIRADGGRADVVDGEFGSELHAMVPVQTNDGLGGSVRRTMQPTRFLGVDGPRWFVRGVLSGAAAADPHSPDLPLLLESLRALVVVRGKEAFGPRDLLPLRLPREALAQQADEASPTLAMPERGPEITETR